MKKSLVYVFLLIIAGLLMTILILIFNNTSATYHFIGEAKNEDADISVDVFIIRNNQGDLLTYNTNISYSKEDIVSARLLYEKDGEKIVVLGNGLNSYNYSEKGYEKSEYGFNYIEKLLENPLYFELCKDDSCDDIYETIELTNKSLN